MADSVKPITQNMSHFTLPATRYLKASPDTAIIGRDMLVDIRFIADLKKVGEHRQPPIVTPTVKTKVELITTTR